MTRLQRYSIQRQCSSQIPYRRCRLPVRSTNGGSAQNAMMSRERTCHTCSSLVVCRVWQRGNKSPDQARIGGRPERLPCVAPNDGQDMRRCRDTDRPTKKRIRVAGPDVRPNTPPYLAQSRSPSERFLRMCQERQATKDMADTNQARKLNPPWRCTAL